jgi:hypothetical protein
MKNTRYRIILLLMCSSILMSCATGPGPVPAGCLYKGDYINIRVPNSDGWHLVSSSPDGMQFARSGSEPNESFAAQVLIFPLEESQTEDEFLSFIKQGFEADTDPKRFDVIKAEFRSIDKRSYPCVQANSIMRDKEAQTSPTHKETLLLQAKSLYCRHPVLKNGVCITYSHRGTSLHPDFDSEAQDFINGVQVPGY